MKLRYIFGALLSALLFTACSDDDTLGSFGDIAVSESYLSIPENGGNVSFKVNATGTWKMSEIFQKITRRDDGTRDTTYEAVPDWLTADVRSGQAGETTVTLHADATNGGRETELQIVSGEHTQFVRVRQGSLEASTATCAEVIAAPDGKTFRVTGTVTRIANTTYGNWYLNDGTGEIYIYGTLDKNGSAGQNNSIAVWGIEVGDVITVEGPKTTYNGTVELVDVTVLDIQKSLVKVESEPATVGKNGGEVDVKVSYKGSGAYVTIPEADREWIRLEETKYIAGEADTAVFRFYVQPNEGAGRKSDLTFSSSNSSASSAVTYNIAQDANVLPHGMNPADPYTVAEAIAKCLEIGATTDGEIYYAKGYISSISSIDTGSYGNATFNISDDGTDDTALTCYRSFNLNNEKFTAEDQIAVGDEVVICGKLVNYKGETPEFSGNVYIYSRKGAAEANEPGTLKNPFTPAQANAFVSGLEVGKATETDYYVKGRIIDITASNQFGTQYGNCTFYISDDGTDKADKFYVFRTLYLGNVKYADDSWLKPQPGDEVIVCGKLVLYAGKDGNVPETSANNSYIYSLNGKTE